MAKHRDNAVPNDPNVLTIDTSTPVVLQQRISDVCLELSKDLSRFAGQMMGMDTEPDAVWTRENRFILLGWIVRLTKQVGTISLLTGQLIVTMGTKV